MAYQRSNSILSKANFTLAAVGTMAYFLFVNENTKFAKEKDIPTGSDGEPLTGPKGDKGDRGPKGDKGDKGEKGDPGLGAGLVRLEPGSIVHSLVQPPSTLLADGSDVSRIAYSGLFASIGTEFGKGDGVTTFGLPRIPSLAVIDDETEVGDDEFEQFTYQTAPAAVQKALDAINPKFKDFKSKGRVTLTSDRKTITTPPIGAVGTQYTTGCKAATYYDPQKCTYGTYYTTTTRNTIKISGVNWTWVSVVRPLYRSCGTYSCTPHPAYEELALFKNLSDVDLVGSINAFIYY